jgi:hypothetical protein
VKRAAVTVLAVILLAGACKKKEDASQQAINAANRVAMRQVRLFYESPDMLLVPETRNLPLPEAAAGALSIVIREYFKGPANQAVPRLFPADTVVRGTYLVGDTAILDLGGTTLTAGWGTGSHQEAMAVYSVVQTVTANFAEARRVRILVNGTPTETLAGHVSLARALGPRADVVDPRFRR